MVTFCLFDLISPPHTFHSVKIHNANKINSWPKMIDLPIRQINEGLFPKKSQQNKLCQWSDLQLPTAAAAAQAESHERLWFCCAKTGAWRSTWLAPAPQSSGSPLPSVTRWLLWWTRPSHRGVKARRVSGHSVGVAAGWMVLPVELAVDPRFPLTSSNTAPK